MLYTHAAAAVVAAFAVFAVMTLRLENAQAKHDAELANLSATAERSARRQSEEHREKERKLRETHDEIEREAQTALAAAATGADRARDAGQRLQRELADYLTQHRARAADAAAAGQCAPDTGAALDLLADLQRRADDRAGALAHIADDARRRGGTCEQIHDADRRTLNAEAPAHAQAQ